MLTKLCVVLFCTVTYKILYIFPIHQVSSLFFLLLLFLIALLSLIPFLLPAFPKPLPSNSFLVLLTLKLIVLFPQLLLYGCVCMCARVRTRAQIYKCNLLCPLLVLCVCMVSNMEMVGIYQGFRVPCSSSGS